MVQSELAIVLIFAGVVNLCLLVALLWIVKHLVAIHKRSFESAMAISQAEINYRTWVLEHEQTTLRLRELQSATPSPIAMPAQNPPMEGINLNMNYQDMNRQ